MTLTTKLNELRALERSASLKAEEPQMEQQSAMPGVLFHGLRNVGRSMGALEAIRVQKEFGAISQIEQTDEEFDKRISEAIPLGTQILSAFSPELSHTLTAIKTQQKVRPMLQEQAAKDAQRKMDAVHEDNLLRDLTQKVEKFIHFEDLKAYGDSLIKNLSNTQTLSPTFMAEYDKRMSLYEKEFQNPPLGRRLTNDAQIEAAAKNRALDFMNAGNYTTESYVNWAQGLFNDIGFTLRGQEEAKTQMTRVLKDFNSVGTVNDILSQPGLSKIFTPDERKAISNTVLQKQVMATNIIANEKDSYAANVQALHNVGFGVPGAHTGNKAIDDMNQFLLEHGAQLQSPEQLMTNSAFDQTPALDVQRQKIIKNHQDDFSEDFVMALRKRDVLGIAADAHNMLKSISIPVYNKDTNALEGNSAFQISTANRASLFGEVRAGYDYSSSVNNMFMKHEMIALHNLMDTTSVMEQWNINTFIAGQYDQVEIPLQNHLKRNRGSRRASEATGVSFFAPFYELAKSSPQGAYDAFRRYAASEKEDKETTRRSARVLGNQLKFDRSADTSYYSDEFFDDIGTVLLGKELAQNSASLVALDPGKKIYSPEGERFTVDETKRIVGDHLTVFKPYGTAQPVYFWDKKHKKIFDAQVSAIKLDAAPYAGAPPGMNTVKALAKTHPQLVRFAHVSGSYNEFHILVAQSGATDTLAEMDRNASAGKYKILLDTNNSPVTFSLDGK